MKKFDFDVFSVEIAIEKENSRKKKVNFQNKMCVSSQNKRMCEDGATVAATPTFSAAGCLGRPFRQRFP
jgi:hypothetical protein